MDKTAFIDNVMKISGIENRSDVERIVVAVFHVLRSQISNIERNDIYYSLSGDLENFWEGGWLQRFISRIQGLSVMDKDDFVEQVRQLADLSTEEESERASRAVFATLKSAIPKSETGHLHDELTNGVLDMWDAA